MQKLDCGCKIVNMAMKSNVLHGRINPCPKHKVKGLKMEFDVTFTTPVDQPKVTLSDGTWAETKTGYHGIFRIFCSTCTPPRQDRLSACEMQGRRNGQCEGCDTC